MEGKMGAFAVSILMVISFILGVLFERIRIWNKFEADFNELKEKAEKEAQSGVGKVKNEVENKIKK